MEEYSYLNRRTISKTFASNGQHVIRVVVSDMKGGVSSRNLIIRVGQKEGNRNDLGIGAGQIKQRSCSGSQSFAEESPGRRTPTQRCRYFARFPNPGFRNQSFAFCHRQRRSQTTDHASRRNSSFLPGSIQRRQSLLLSLIVRTMSLPK